MNSLNRIKQIWKVQSMNLLWLTGQSMKWVIKSRSGCLYVVNFLCVETKLANLMLTFCPKLFHFFIQRNISLVLKHIPPPSNHYKALQFIHWNGLYDNVIKHFPPSYVNCICLCLTNTTENDITKAIIIILQVLRVLGLAPLS